MKSIESWFVWPKEDYELVNDDDDDEIPRMVLLPRVLEPKHRNMSIKEQLKKELEAAISFWKEGIKFSILEDCGVKSNTLLLLSFSCRLQVL
jgi:hypothetical protein